MHCSNCGIELPVGAKYCLNCGVAVTSQQIRTHETTEICEIRVKSKDSSMGGGAISWYILEAIAIGPYGERVIARTNKIHPHSNDLENDGEFRQARSTLTDLLVQEGWQPLPSSWIMFGWHKGHVPRFQRIISARVPFNDTPREIKVGNYQGFELPGCLTIIAIGIVIVLIGIIGSCLKSATGN